MSAETERISVYQRLIDNWDEQKYGPLTFDNQILEIDAENPYAVFSSFPVNDTQASIGGEKNRFRRYRTYQLDYLVPVETGTSLPRDLEDDFFKWFANQQIRTSDDELMTFRQPIYRVLGREQGFQRYVYEIEVFRDWFAANPAP